MKTQTSRKDKRFILKVLFGFLLPLILNSSCSIPSKYVGQSKKFELKYNNLCATDTSAISDSFTFGGVTLKYYCQSISPRDYADGMIFIVNDSGTPIKLSLNDSSGENSLVVTPKYLFSDGSDSYTPQRKGITGEILFLPNNTSYYEEDFAINLANFSCDSDADRTAHHRTTVVKLSVYISAECTNAKRYEPREGTRFSNYRAAQVITKNKRFVLNHGEQVVFNEMTGTYSFKIRYPLQFFKEN